MRVEAAKLTPAAAESAEPAAKNLGLASPASGVLSPPIGLAVYRKCFCGGSDRPCANCEDATQNKLLRKDAGRVAPMQAPPIVHQVLNSPGRPLDAATRSFMERGFGFDFSRVRIHTDSRASESANAVNALAYTVGQNVVFGAGQYRPQTSEGRRLLAHELTHTVQQRESSRNYIARDPDPAAAGKPKVKTGIYKDRWHYVAYLDQGLIRLGRDVKRDDVTVRIGTIPWLTNNPGNLAVSNAADAGPGAKEPLKQGAYAKTAADADPDTRRYAIFASRDAGLAAIFPVLKVLNESNGGKLSLKSVLKIYKGTDPSEDESVKTSYVSKIKQFMAEGILNESPSLSQPQAISEADKILNKPFSSLSQGDMEYEIARDALTREEGRLNPPGVEYSCKDGFADINTKTDYTSEQWTAIDALKALKGDIHSLLECP